MNQFRHKLTDDPEKKGKARKGVWKVLRVNKRKAHYAAQPMRTLANEKRRLARHLRHFPEDAAGVKLCASKYSETFAAQCVAAAVGKARARAKAAVRQRRRTLPGLSVLETQLILGAIAAIPVNAERPYSPLEPPAYVPLA